MKATIIALASFTTFFLLCAYLVGPLCTVFLIGGDDFINSYFGPLIAGLAALAAILITCSYIILRKLNTLLEELRKEKGE